MIWQPERMAGFSPSHRLRQAFYARSDSSSPLRLGLPDYSGTTDTTDTTDSQQILAGNQPKFCVKFCSEKRLPLTCLLNFRRFLAEKLAKKSASKRAMPT